VVEETSVPTVEKETSPASALPGESKRAARVKESLQVLGLTLLAALILRAFVIEAFRIPTSSMSGTLLVGDFLLVNKVIYGSTSPRTIPFTNIPLPHFSLPAVQRPKTGDVMVFIFPGYPDQRAAIENASYVKRCIGTPGDTILIQDKMVFVNGRELLFPRHALVNPVSVTPRGAADNSIFPHGSSFNRDNYGPLIVPKKGDIISLTKENLGRWKVFIEREGHAVEENGQGQVMVDGKFMDTYSVEKNYYFVMGDNRDDSLDSRFWGFVADDLIVGKVMMAYWSWDESKNEGGLLTQIRWDRIGMMVH